MRLSAEEVELIVEVFSSWLANEQWELYLFGSRVNDLARGGDIDLLLLINDEQAAKDIQTKKHYLLVDLKNAIGDQKIDLTIKNKNDQELFIKMVLSQAVLLKKQL